MIEIITYDNDLYVIAGNNIDEDENTSCMYADEKGLAINIDDNVFVFNKSPEIDKFYSENDTKGIIKFDSGKIYEIPKK